MAKDFDGGFRVVNFGVELGMNSRLAVVIMVVVCGSLKVMAIV